LEFLSLFFCFWENIWDFFNHSRSNFRNKKLNCQETSLSFNEPTFLLEYAVDVFKLAKSYGYYNTYVTNGYMSEKALQLLIEAGLDGINIDVKGDKKVVKLYCNADAEKIWRNAKIAKEKGIKTLEAGIEIGKDIRLKYVYCGNVPGHKFENTIALIVELF
jgi:pyruvate-formate lyase-activating enzyme